MEEFIPTTFRMDVKEEREDFFSRNAPPEGETGKTHPVYIKLTSRCNDNYSPVKPDIPHVCWLHLAKINHT